MTGSLIVRRSNGRNVRFEGVPERASRRVERVAEERIWEKSNGRIGNGMHGVNLPPLLAADLERTKAGAPSHSSILSGFVRDFPSINQGEILPVMLCTDIAKITRKRSKPDKHEHENGKRYPMIERIQGQRSNPRGACEEDLEASSPAINRRLLSLTKKSSRSSFRE
ncbi:hypothetical protein Tco_0803268 [Tanacetum coccineum]|uniref:Uncharacterized protein n=1 Tax=Tanacetum coccineum TaxID=301880 RepID=A0ABQ5A133_9ASTR